MVGHVLKGEKEIYADEKTKAEITKLTTAHNNFHFYFTDNSFLKGDKEILFLSDRGGKENVYNIFKMDLGSGDMVCLSDEKDIEPNKYTKTPDGDIVLYIAGKKIKRLDLETGKSVTIYETSEHVNIASISISCDKKYAIFLENEATNIVPNQPNYGGFIERMYAIKKCRFVLLDIETAQPQIVYEDSHQCAHVQFSPNMPYIVSYCHEGPWNLVHQRIWILNLLTRTVIPCVRQGQDDCIGHELWTRDGLIFFDNRGKGHDGTITDSKAQAYAKAPEDGSQAPHIGFVDYRGNVLRTMDMPFYCNHYHLNNDNSLLVGDEVDDIVLINISGGKPEIKILCQHGTSWRSQIAHGHPTFSWDGQKILFASDRGGNLNIYLAEV